MKVTLIHNPDAGSTDESCADEIANSIRAAGHSVVCQSCRNAGWEKALLEPGDLVAVAGGDGIVGTVAKQMIGKSVPIAVLPMGTANNIASTLGLTGLSMDDLIRGWRSARRIQLDVGAAHGHRDGDALLRGEMADPAARQLFGARARCRGARAGLGSDGAAGRPRPARSRRAALGAALRPRAGGAAAARG